MKVAHLILAHKDPAQVQRLVNRITHPDGYVFIHVDKKHDLDGFLGLQELPNVYLVKNRIEVNWGGYSIVQATINSLQEITGSGIGFDYVNLISGQDYPIKPIDSFVKHLKQHPGKCFFNYCLPGDPWLIEAEQKMNSYFFTDAKIKGKYLLEKILKRILPKREVPDSYTVLGRSAWFTIDMESIKYILKCDGESLPIIKFFKHCWGSDEMFFHTLIYNSDLKHKMVNHNYRHIDWSEGNPRPKTLTMADAKVLEATDAFFARKFDQDTEILDYIDKTLLKPDNAV